MTADTAGWQPLLEACAAAAAALPVGQTELMAQRAAQVTNPTGIPRIQDQPPTANFRVNAGAVATAWQHTSPPVHGTTVAAMLRAANHATQRTRREQSVDLVWTGPGTNTIYAQPTSDVVVNLMGEAQRTLILSTFASRRVPRVRDALTAAASRGVKITLILENEQSSQGHYQQAKLDPFAGVEAETLEWPADKRPTQGGWTSALHAKFVLVDETALFITSANLTGAALDSNIETGALIRGGPLPGRLVQHLRDLTYNGTLTPISSR